MIVTFIIIISLLVITSIYFISSFDLCTKNSSQPIKSIYRNKHTGALAVAIFTKRANQRVVICKYLNRKTDKPLIFKQEDFLKHFYFEPLENI